MRLVLVELILVMLASLATYFASTYAHQPKLLNKVRQGMRLVSVELILVMLASLSIYFAFAYVYKPSLTL